MMKQSCILMAFAALAFGSATCPVSDKPYQTAINEIFAGGPTTIRDLIDLQQSYVCFLNYVLLQYTPAERNSYFARSFADLQQTLKNYPSPNVQTGSSNSTNGSTNLVAEGATAQVLSVANEYGALTETTSGQTVTVKGSLDGPLVAATRQYLLGFCPDEFKLDPYCVHERTHQILSSLSYGVTFNTSSGSQSAIGTPTSSGSSGTSPSTAQPVMFTASGRQISSITASFSFYPKTRNLPKTEASNEFKKAWSSAVAASAPGSPDTLRQATGVLATQFVAFLTAIGLPADPVTVEALPDTDPRKPFLKFYIEQWWPKTEAILKDDLAQKNQQKFESDLNAAIADLYTHVLTVDPTLPQQAADILRASSAARFEVQQKLLGVLQSIAKQPLLTLEYDDSRPQNQDSYSTVRLIANKGFGKSAQWMFTFNGAFAFNTKNYVNVPGYSTYRSAQAGAELKYTFGNLSILGSTLGNAALSATYYYQHQNSPSVLNVTPATPLTGITFTGLPSTATQVFAEKGTINIGQVRFELGSGSSLKFPIAVSYSNRTELIAKPELRAQIGVSYNFDSLFTSSGPR